MQLWIYLAIFIITVHAICALDILSSTACYGPSVGSVIEANCGPGHVLAVRNLKAMAKLKSDACPDEMTPDDIAGTTSDNITGTSDNVTDAATPVNTTAIGENCCVFQETDCGVRYYGSDYADYYNACHGQQSCSYPVARVDTAQSTSCDTDVFMENTTYMLLEYNCISAAHILSPCESMTAQSESVYLWNNGYSNEMTAGSDDCICSVEVSCSTHIQLIALDTRFLKEDGNCKQMLIVNEKGTLNYVACNSNNNFSVRTVYTSSYFFLILRISNDLSTNGGNVWIEISGSDSQAELSLSCGAEARSTISTTSGKVYCGTNVTDPLTVETITEATTNGGDEPEDGGPAVNGENTTEPDESSKDTSTVLAIILLVTLLVFLGILLGIACWKRDVIKRQLCAEKGKVEDSKSEPTASERSSSPAVYDTMPNTEGLLATSNSLTRDLPGDGIIGRKVQLEPLFPNQRPRNPRLTCMDNRKPLSSIGTIQELPEAEDNQLFPVPFKPITDYPHADEDSLAMSEYHIQSISKQQLPPIDNIGSNGMKPRLALLSMIMNMQNRPLSPVETNSEPYAEVYADEHENNRRRRKEVSVVDYEPISIPTPTPRYEKRVIKKKKKRLMEQMNQPYETAYLGHLSVEPRDQNI